MDIYEKLKLLYLENGAKCTVDSVFGNLSRDILIKFLKELIHIEDHREQGIMATAMAMVTVTATAMAKATATATAMTAVMERATTTAIAMEMVMAMVTATAMMMA